MLRPFVIAIRIHSSCQVLFDGCEGILTLRVATILQPYHMRAWALFHWGSPKILALWGPPGGLISLVIWGRGAPYRGGPHIAPTPVDSSVSLSKLFIMLLAIITFEPLTRICACVHFWWNFDFWTTNCRFVEREWRMLVSLVSMKQQCEIGCHICCSDFAETLEEHLIQLYISGFYKLLVFGILDHFQSSCNFGQPPAFL